MMRCRLETHAYVGDTLRRGVAQTVDDAQAVAQGGIEEKCGDGLLALDVGQWSALPFLTSSVLHFPQSDLMTPRWSSFVVSWSDGLTSVTLALIRCAIVETTTETAIVQIRSFFVKTK